MLCPNRLRLLNKHRGNESESLSRFLGGIIFWSYPGGEGNNGTDDTHTGVSIGLEYNGIKAALFLCLWEGG